MADIYFKRPGGILKYDSKVYSLTSLDRKYERCDKNGKPLAKKKPGRPKKAK